MIKRYLLVILSISLFLSSCVQSPDDMLKQFNDNLYEDIGNGMYQHGDVIINKALIPKDVYSIFEYDIFKLRVSQAYMEYNWTLKDNETESSYNIDGFYILRIGPQDIKLVGGRSYTLTLNVINVNGVLYQDSATIKVVKRNKN